MIFPKVSHDFPAGRRSWPGRARVPDAQIATGNPTTMIQIRYTIKHGGADKVS